VTLQALINLDRVVLCLHIASSFVSVTSLSYLFNPSSTIDPLLDAAFLGVVQADRNHLRGWICAIRWKACVLLSGHFNGTHNIKGALPLLISKTFNFPLSTCYFTPFEPSVPSLWLQCSLNYTDFDRFLVFVTVNGFFIHKGCLLLQEALLASQIFSILQLHFEKSWGLIKNV
jgi:hypothetical protein